MQTDAEFKGTVIEREWTEHRLQQEDMIHQPELCESHFLSRMSPQCSAEGILHIEVSAHVDPTHSQNRGLLKEHFIDFLLPMLEGGYSNLTNTSGMDSLHSCAITGMWIYLPQGSGKGISLRL